MADIELNGELIVLRKRADSEWARLRALQERYGRPSVAGGWSMKAHAEWDAARVRWSEAVDAVRAAVGVWALKSGQRRIDVEARLTGTVRGGKDPQIWPEAEAAAS
ncbi:hypothetical protein [Streptomyces sp. NPDC048606]|uniref:hypothetical protein n=1 Tax=Streptomyces sp. NPDC048606 TaxID=3154726 RepID=UPI0034249948